MITAPNTADVMEKPIKTPTWKISESKPLIASQSGLFIEAYNIWLECSHDGYHREA